MPGVYHHGNHFPFNHGRSYLRCQVPPTLSVLFKGLAFLFNHVLQLSPIGSHIGAVLILPKEGSNQILPSADVGSF